MAFFLNTRAALYHLLDPRTAEPSESLMEATAEHVDLAVQNAQVSDQWKSSPKTRRDILHRYASKLESHIDHLVKAEQVQTGKPVADALSDVQEAIECFRHFAGYADTLTGSAIDSEDKLIATTIREPKGVVGIITSFNYPVSLSAWKLAPALAAGNSVIVKPARQTPLTALMMADLGRGIFPEGVMSVLPGGADVGQSITSHQGISHVSFTGSTHVGQKVMQDAATSNLKSVTLECGGKNAVVVLKDADINLVVQSVIGGAFSNAGQNCCASSRLMIHQDVYDRVVEQILDRASMLQRDRDLGPLIDKTQYERVMGYINRATETLALGGKPWSTKGYYISPTVYINVSDQSALASEEIFGPVLAILEPFEDPAQAVQRVNASPYGLASGIFSKDTALAQRMARSIHTGIVWINTYNYIPMRVPFGGAKMSGIGKDLGREAMDEFTFIKSILTPF
ncbi:aldehyde dehydrogenase domain-containing protein [Umbelopsis sp. PMI_123]|nr:aldehyde dehydrogenase domain-containing protein [Umbelopsis sp. PMI_123]